MADKSSPKRHLTQAQSALALSLLTDVMNQSRAAVTFTIHRGELVEISSGKTLLEEHPQLRPRKRQLNMQPK
jgi:hypothetical protein